MEEERASMVADTDDIVDGTSVTNSATMFVDVTC